MAQQQHKIWRTTPNTPTTTTTTIDTPPPKVKKRKAKGGQTTASGQGVEASEIITEPKLKLVNLTKLPKVLGSRIKGIKPVSICQIPYTGFDVYAWQDQNEQGRNVSKLSLEILDPISMVSTRFRVPSQAVMKLWKNSDWGKMRSWVKSNIIPLDTIIVTSKDGTNERMEAKKMVLDFLDS